ncbi:MAG: DUF2156 domain-containing protein [Clostridiaceae bacterium]|nr:DUF2156 domain-containing protein [Clostridiaceae bacterium]
MLEFKPLSLEDNTFLQKYLKPYSFKTCEYSFTNLFIWRKGCDIKYTTYKDVLILLKTDFNNNYYFMQPIGYNKENLKEIIEILIQYKQENQLLYLFKDLETNFIEDFREIYPDSFEIIEDIDNFDYIYESSKLISLSGKKLHGKKNHYNNFVKNNEYRTSPINCENICECIIAAREWVYKNDSKGYLLYELEAIEELLKNRCNLHFDGMAVYVDNKLSAFTIGEKINEVMAIIHIEKAASEINGLYAYINKTFIETYYSEVPFINREQDLGIEGLRRAKKTYYPLKLEPKYIIK